MEDPDNNFFEGTSQNIFPDLIWGFHKQEKLDSALHENPPQGNLERQKVSIDLKLQKLQDLMLNHLTVGSNLTEHL